MTLKQTGENDQAVWMLRHRAGCNASREAYQECQDRPHDLCHSPEKEHNTEAHPSAGMLIICGDWSSHPVASIGVSPAAIRLGHFVPEPVDREVIQWIDDLVCVAHLEMGDRKRR